jgi:hypothetical protein
MWKIPRRGFSPLERDEARKVRVSKKGLGGLSEKKMCTDSTMNEKVKYPTLHLNF